MRFLSGLARARLFLYVCGASTSTGWAHTSHTQTQTHTQAKTHASPCANSYGDADRYADGYGNTDSDSDANRNTNSDSYGNSYCNPISDRHRYAASRCSDFSAARREWDGQIPD